MTGSDTKLGAMRANVHDPLAERIARVFPRLDPGAQQLALNLYRQLARGAPVAREVVARSTGLDADHVQATLDQWPGVQYDDQRRIIGFWGLSIGATMHRFDINQNTLYTWCAWDTLFLPQLLDTTAAVTSKCATTGDAIRLTVAPDTVVAHEPSDMVVSFLIPDAHQFQENIVTSFCHFVHLFSSRAAGAAWTADHPDTFLLTLQEAFVLGRQFNARRYPQFLPGGIR